MKYLLNNELAPLTFNWAFIEAPLQDVVSRLKTWREGRGRKLQIYNHSASLSGALSRLDPLTSPANRELFIKTRSPWTALFDNALGGGDVFTPTKVLARMLQARGIAVSCVPHTYKGKGKQATGVYGGVQMHLYGPKNEGSYRNVVRSIAAVNDGGKWVFQTFGDVQPWEQPEHYQVKRIQDRFLPELLASYCAFFGLDVFCPEFYGPEAACVSSDEPLLATASLEIQRKEMGIVTGVNRSTT